MRIGNWWRRVGIGPEFHAPDEFIVVAPFSEKVLLSAAGEPPAFMTGAASVATIENFKRHVERVDIVEARMMRMNSKNTGMIIAHHIARPALAVANKQPPSGVRVEFDDIFTGEDAEVMDDVHPSV